MSDFEEHLASRERKLIMKCIEEELQSIIWLLYPEQSRLAGSARLKGGGLPKILQHCSFIRPVYNKTEQDYVCDNKQN